MLAALLLASGLAWAEHPLSNPRVYVGPEGLRVVVAMAKSDACVLQVLGTRGPLDGLVFDCTVERADLQTKHFITLRGRKKLALKADGQGTAGVSEATGLLSFSDTETKKENLEALWAKHQSQAAQLAALAKFDRAAESAELARRVKDATEPLNRACGTKIAFTLDWSAATDELFQASRPEESCLKVISAMTEMCGRYKVARSTFAEKLTEVRCTFAEDREPVMTLEGTKATIGTNNWTVSLPGAWDKWIVEVL